MQILIDTNTDNAAELYRIGRWLVDAFETIPAAALDASSINGAAAPVELKPDFLPSDSLPPNGPEIVKAAPAPVPLPPNLPPIDLFPQPPSLPPIPAPPGPAPVAERDAAGVAYDANLHSSTRSKTIDGKWKARRNRGSAAAPVVVPAVTIPAPPTSLPNAGPPVVAPFPSPPDVPRPPTVFLPDDAADPEAGESDPVLPAPSQGSLMDFATFIEKVTQGMTAGTLTQAKIAQVQTQFGIAGLFDLNARPTLVDDVARAFGFL